MGKNKGARVIITLRCTNCKKGASGNEKTKILVNQIGQAKTNHKKIDYTTTKNRRNTSERLELKKFCPNCNSHTQQKEIR